MMLRLSYMPQTELAGIMHAADMGDTDARDQLFTILYGELRRMAERELRRGGRLTLSPTTLLHETFLNVSQRESLGFASYGQFMSYAARAMRGLVINHIRDRRAQKRGGKFHITSLETEPQVSQDEVSSRQLEDLSDALQELEKRDAQLAECIDLKFFCGHSFEEIAAFRKVSERTVRRDWEKARLLLNGLIDRKD
jgi:RNA polymerase sigma factor (TIGR02999 family)